MADKRDQKEMEEKLSTSLLTHVHVYWGHWCTVMVGKWRRQWRWIAARLLLNLINLKRFMQIIPINGLNLRNLIIILLPFFLFWGTIIIISGQAKKKHKEVRIYVTEDLWPHDERQRRITEAPAAYKKGWGVECGDLGGVSRSGVWPAAIRHGLTCQFA